MKPKSLLLLITLSAILLLLLTGCRRFGRPESSVPQTSVTSKQSEPATSVTENQTVSSPETVPADSGEVAETIDQILSELTELDSVYSQLDTVTDADLSN